MLKNFKEFAFGGSLVESAVAFVMAIAAAALMGSLVEHIITPIIGAIFGQPDFSALSIDIGDGSIAYGAFLNALITFTSVAFAVYFFIVKPYTTYKAKTSSPPEDTPIPEDIALLREIHDGLARR